MNVTWRSRGGTGCRSGARVLFRFPRGLCPYDSLGTDNNATEHGVLQAATQHQASPGRSVAEYEPTGHVTFTAWMRSGLLAGIVVVCGENHPCR